MDDERDRGCTDDVLHADFDMFVKAHLNTFFLPVARRYAGYRWIPDAAPDIAQEALARAWPRWEVKLAWEPCQTRCAWVCVTMSNVALEEHRKQRQAALPVDPATLPEGPSLGAGPETRYLVSEVVDAVAKVLQGFSRMDRLIIELAIAKIPHAVIADQLGLSSPTSVSTRLHRVRTRLVRRLPADLLTDLGLQSGLDPSGGAA